MFGSTFGSTANNSAFGAKPAGTGLFGTPTSTAGTTFGQPASTGFGQPATTGFGQTTGSTFGQPAATTFGQPAATTGFGQTGTAFGQTSTGFGQPAATTGFGQPATSTGGFSFGTTTSSAPSTGFSFGNTTTTTGTSTFGNTGTFGAPATNTFGTPSTNTFGTSTFGTGGTTGFNTGSSFGAPTSFGGGFGSTTNTGTGGFSFNNNNTAKPGGFPSFGGGTLFGGAAPAGGATPAPAAPSPAVQHTNSIISAVTVPMIFNDDRDKVIASFNQVQAKWGVGKGYFAQSQPPISFTENNPFSKFRTVGYNNLPTSRPEDGLVVLRVNKKIDDVKAMAPPLTDQISQNVIKSATHSIFLDNMVERGDQTEVTIYCINKQPNGVGTKITSTELCNNLQQPMYKTLLAPLGIVDVAEKTEIPKALIEQFLSNPPDGIDPLIWEQAKMDNPDPTKYCPVPLNGFEDLNVRLKCQQDQQGRQMACLEKMATDAAELEKKCISTKARIEEYKRKQQEIAHRVLQVMVVQEVHRKMGLGIQSEEERLKVSLEELMTEIESQTRGKLNELQANIKTVNAPPQSTEGPQVQIDEPLSEELSKLLIQQQKGIAGLVTILKEDLKALDQIQKTFSISNV